MNATQWNKTKHVFARVVPLGEPDRSRTLDSLCDGDDEVRSSVITLLHGDSAANHSLADPPAIVGLPKSNSLLPDPSPTLPYSIKDFIFQERLGSGRSGVVYRARQVSMERDVAVKVFAPSIRAAGITTRLRREIGASARIHHPGIAQVISAESLEWPDGTTRSALVMELVRGSRIAASPRAGQAGVREIVQLIVQVCDAVAAAHRAGVIHHDLKPANIMVEEDAGFQRVRLVDFGIAAIIGDAATMSDIYGSLRYFAPERSVAAGQLTPPPDARSDIFSVGVVLDELVTTAVGSSRGVPRDLACIAAKASSPSPEDRYGTIDALAADLRRYLERRTISARPASSLYSLARLVQRSPGRTALAIAALAGAIGMVAVQGVESARTENARLESRNAASVLLNEVAESVRDEVGASARRYELLMRLRPTLEQFADRYPDEPRTQADLATLLGSLGDFRQQRGDLEGAREILLRALGLRERVARMLPDDADAQADLSIALVRVGDVTNDIGPSQPYRSRYLAALALDQSLVTRWPDNPRLLSNLAFSHERLGRSASAQARFADADDHAESQLAIARRVMQLIPGSERALRTLVGALATRAELLRLRFEYSKVMPAVNELLTALDELDRVVPRQRGVQKMRVDTLISLADGLKMSGANLSSAVPTLTRAVLIAEHLYRGDPTDAYCWNLYVRAVMLAFDLGVSLGDASATHRALRDLDTATDLLSRSAPNEPAFAALHLYAQYGRACTLLRSDRARATSIIRAALPEARQIASQPALVDHLAIFPSLVSILSDATADEINEAIAMLARARDIDPQNRTQRTISLVYALRQAGNNAQATRELDALIASIPETETLARAALARHYPPRPSPATSSP